MVKQPKNAEATARRFVAEGISFLMIKIDGSKSPIESWERWQSERPSQDEVDRWFAGDKNRGIGMICGAVSGNLEVVDLDQPEVIPSFEALVNEALPGLLEQLVVVGSPKGGRHYIYRSSEPVAGNQKLAMRMVGSQQVCLIETRGEGGYVLAPGSPSRCHPLNKPYLLLQNHYSQIPILTLSDRDRLLECARRLNEYNPPIHQRANRSCRGLRPGDDFTNRATSQTVAKMLIAQGWKLAHTDRRGNQQWRRPGKPKGSTSATLFDSGILHVFSSNAYPFELEHSYTPFDVLALTQFNGDFTAAAKKLAEMGFGK
jgi:putative DNA primase/helicase